MSGFVYSVPRTAGADWSVPARVPLTHTGWLPPCPIAAWFQACHDEACLYLRMEAEESPVRATLIGPLEQVCRDSCLEFFSRPTAEIVTSILSSTRSEHCASASVPDDPLG